MPIEAQLLRYDLYETAGGDHAYLDRVGEDVRKHGVQLLGEEVRRGLHDVCDAGGVWAVRAVIALMANTPLSVMAFRSA